MKNCCFNLLTKLLHILPNKFFMWFWYRIINWSGKTARIIRVIILTRLAISIDKSVNIARLVIISDIDKLKIGKNVSINEGCFISAYGGLTIGDNVSIGHSTTILSSDHCFKDISTPIKEQGIIPKETFICNDTFIGARCIILGGIKVNFGSIVGAGAVVTKDVPEKAIVAGNPAKIIKYRNGEENVCEY